MVNWATQKPFNFLYINKTVPMKDRYRKNLDEIINLDVFRKATRKPNTQAYENQLDALLEQDGEPEEHDAAINVAQRQSRICGKNGKYKKSLRGRWGSDGGRRQYCNVYGGPPHKKIKADYEE